MIMTRSPLRFGNVYKLPEGKGLDAASRKKLSEREGGLRSVMPSNNHRDVFITTGQHVATAIELEHIKRKWIEASGNPFASQDSADRAARRVMRGLVRDVTPLPNDMHLINLVDDGFEHEVLLDE